MKTIATTRPEVASREEGITAREERLTEQKESVLEPRHYLNFLAWLIPGALLAFLPKCPMCLAAYVAVATGIGISLPTATYVRATLLVLCASSLLYVLVRRLRPLPSSKRLSQERELIFSESKPKTLSYENY
ncbi:MAG TPA: hypothetical protein VIT23_00885 [Terrimicrobiaceae bacterium]